MQACTKDRFFEHIYSEAATIRDTYLILTDGVDLDVLPEDFVVSDGQLGVQREPLMESTHTLIKFDESVLDGGKAVVNTRYGKMMMITS